MGAYGDGEHDDTAIIKKAISYISAIYNNYKYNSYFNTISFPKGQYLITSTITIPNYVCLKMHGNIIFVSKVEGICLLFNNDINIQNVFFYGYHGERIIGNLSLVRSSAITIDDTIGIQIQSSNSLSGSNNFNS